MIDYIYDAKKWLVSKIQTLRNNAKTHMDLYKKLEELDETNLVRERLIWDRTAGIQLTLQKQIVDLRKEVLDLKQQIGCGGNCKCKKGKK
jgi:hypothetical protein